MMIVAVSAMRIVAMGVRVRVAMAMSRGARICWTNVNRR
jgi:hypothetical protein